MKVVKTKIPEVVIIEPKVWADERGYFYESYKKEIFEQKISSINFIQENESKSTFGSLRGLHYQLPPFVQSKLVRVILGRVLDVAIDMRDYSLTFGKHVCVELSSENKKQLFIPQGFAHGFLTLSEDAIFQYKVDNYYSKESEAGIKYDDEYLNIDWPIDSDKIILSEKDLILPDFKNSIKFK